MQEEISGDLVQSTSGQRIIDTEFLISMKGNIRDI